MISRRFHTVFTANRYKYGAKELATDLGLNAYDFEARMQSPALPMFAQIDPMAEKYYSLSPYAYCAGNPISFVDPSGRIIEFAPSCSEDFKQRFRTAYAKMKELGIDRTITAVMNRSETIYVADGRSLATERHSGTMYDATDRTIYWAPDQSLLSRNEIKEKVLVINPLQALSHEGDHALQSLENPQQQDKDKATTEETYGDMEEMRVITGSDTENDIILGVIEPGEISPYKHFGHVVTIDCLTPSDDDVLDAYEEQCYQRANAQ